MFKPTDLFAKLKAKKDPCSIARKAISTIFSNPADYMIVEIQTTGIEDCHIVEIAIADIYGNIHYNQLINPQCHMPEPTTLHNGITDEMLANQPLIFDVLIQRLLWLDGRILISWNSEFVSKVFNRELASVLSTPFAERRVSVKELYEKIRGASLSIDEALRQESRACGAGHRAEDNCLDTLRILKLLHEEA